MGKIMYMGEAYTASPLPNAGSIEYDNSTSHLTATTMQGAVDELVLDRLTSEDIKSTWITLSSANYSITGDSSLTKVGNMIFVNINIQSTSNYDTSSQFVIGTVAEAYRSSSAINTFCISSASQWGNDTFNNCYCYLATTGSFTVKVMASNQKFIKISFAYSV